MDYLTIIGYVVGIIGLTVGVIFGCKWKQVVDLMRELGEAFTVTSEALEDKNLTKAEAIQLLSEWEDVFTKIMVMVGKK